MSKRNYSNGVYVEIEDDAVYIGDHMGEIVCWVNDELIEDPSLWTTVANAITYAISNGGEASRLKINHPESLQLQLDPEQLLSSDIFDCFNLMHLPGGVHRELKWMSQNENIVYLTFDKKRIKFSAPGQYVEYGGTPINMPILESIVKWLLDLRPLAKLY